jgi:2-(1,2-epoxy-1,2-dihydrophenyl)acetyl-CoA isomerase
MASAVPIVVGVQGWAVGGGLSLALLGDVLVLGRSARVRAAYTAIGLTPDGGMSWTLPRVVGASRARDLILTNRAISAAEAEAMGLATRVVDDQELRATVDRLAAELADGATDALGAARDLVHRGVVAVIRFAVTVEPLAVPLTRTVLPTGNCCAVPGIRLVPNCV